MSTEDDWIAEKIAKQTDEALMQMARDADARISGKNSDPPRPMPLPAKPVPRDPVAEQAAYAELLQFMADNTEDDCEFTALSLDEFAEETFTPPVPETQEPQS